MNIEPQPQHLWLQKLVGEWTFEGEATGGPDHPPHKMSGTETVRSVGGLWIVSESRAAMPVDGAPAIMLLTIGFDPRKGRFVGTWLGSMMDYLWTYEGDLAGNTLTLETTGPNMSPEGGMANYRESTEVVTDDHRIFRSAMQMPDGSWNTFMTMHHHRKS